MKLNWHIEKRKLSEIKPYEHNPRRILEKPFKDLQQSIDKFGLAEPLVIQPSGLIIGGHARYEALKAEGATEADCYVPDRELTEAEMKELNVRLNKNIAGEFDFDILANEFEIEELKDWGFENQELDLIESYLEEEKDADDVPEVRPTTDIKLGDIFQLGDHRLLCGDSTKKEDVEKIMDGKKADMVFTSPPYNLGVSANLSGNTRISKTGNAYQNYDDKQDESCWLDLMNRFTVNTLDFAEYVFVNVQSLAGNRTSLWKWVNTFASKFCDVAVWDKGHSAPTMAHKVMNSVFEMIFVFKKDKPSRSIGQKEYRGTIDNIFRIPPQRHNEFADIHGATFPVQLPETIINTFTNREGTVLDVFLGSGSTLIACEKTSRICYGIEIDPIYCQVIIDRFEQFSGKKAVKLS